MKQEWFSDIDEIIADDFRFKAQLKIGEDAYTSLKMKRLAFTSLDTAGAVSFGTTVAGSAFVANKFFAVPGLLGLLGIGTAATPVGWLIAAGVLSGVAWMGIVKCASNDNGEKIVVVPNFINTPIDLLAVSFFDLMAPLALKVAVADGRIDFEEMEVIERFFVKEWGYSAEFVEEGLAFHREKLEDISISEIASAIGRLTRDNPDFNYGEVTKAICLHLRQIALADGKVCEMEEIVIQKIEDIFDHENPASIRRKADDVNVLIKSGKTSVKQAVGALVKRLYKK